MVPSQFCPKCTFIMQPGQESCEMCGESAPSVVKAVQRLYISLPVSRRNISEEGGQALKKCSHCFFPLQLTTPDFCQNCGATTIKTEHVVQSAGLLALGQEIRAPGQHPEEPPAGMSPWQKSLWERARDKERNAEPLKSEQMDLLENYLGEMLPSLKDNLVGWEEVLAALRIILEAENEENILPLLKKRVNCSGLALDHPLRRLVAALLNPVDF